MCKCYVLNCHFMSFTFITFMSDVTLGGGVEGITSCKLCALYFVLLQVFIAVHPDFHAAVRGCGFGNCFLISGPAYLCLAG